MEHPPQAGFGLGRVLLHGWGYPNTGGSVSGVDFLEAPQAISVIVMIIKRIDFIQSVPVKIPGYHSAGDAGD